MTAKKTWVMISDQAPHCLAGLQQAVEQAGSAWVHLHDLDILSLPDDAVICEWAAGGPELKHAWLAELEGLIQPETLIFSAAHQQAATQLASGLSHPDRLVGFSPLGYLFNRPVVSLSRPLQLPARREVEAAHLWEAIGATVHWVADTPGMVTPRIYAMLANEAAFALQEQVASAEDIDLAMTLGTNYPLGPLRWADTVGLDQVLQILEGVYAAYQHPRYRPALLLRQMVWAGYTGIAAGRGFFHYANSPAVAPI